MESGTFRAIFINSNVQTVEESTLFIWDLFLCLEFQSVTSRNGQLYLYDEIADEIERVCASIFIWVIFSNFIYVFLLLCKGFIFTEWMEQYGTNHDGDWNSGSLANKSRTWTDIQNIIDLSCEKHCTWWWYSFRCNQCHWCCNQLRIP